jgi:histone-binding protein RBBP4
MEDEELTYDKAQYDSWKQLTPLLYDWFTNHNLTWPSLSCRWGRVKEDQKWKRKQLLYLSEQTTGNAKNTLTIMTADVIKPRVAAGEVIRTFNESNKSPYIKRQQTIFHPGEVNKIREVPGYESIIVTHTDQPELYVWSLERQPDRAQDRGSSKQQDSVADMVLVGHKDIAEFAEGISNAAPLVASGGRDTNVLIWNLGDQVTSLSAVGGMPSTAFPQTKLSPQTTLQGHESTIEDVVFKPGSGECLASVGDDQCLLLWDTRAGTAPATRVAQAHGAHDLHTVDWCGLRDYMVATGAADGTIKVWDTRQLGGPNPPALHTFSMHTEAVMRVEWSPHRAGGLASSGEDRLVHIWDLDQKRETEGAPEAKRARVALPKELMLTHAGHRAPVVDFQWNPHDPWTIMSVSDESQMESGGTLQLWRISDLLHRPEEEVLAELEANREFIVTGKMPGKPAEGEAPAAADGAEAASAQNGMGDTAAEAGANAAAAAADAAADAAEAAQGAAEAADAAAAAGPPTSPKAAQIANAAVAADAAAAAGLDDAAAPNGDAPPATDAEPMQVDDAPAAAEGGKGSSQPEAAPDAPPP